MADEPASLTAQAFRRALAKVQVVAERHASIPILATVLAKSDGETLTLTTTDLDRRATVSLPSPGSEPFEAAIWARALTRFVSGLTGDLTIAPHASGKVRMACGDVSGLVETLPAGDFPAMALPESTKEGEPVARHTIVIDGGDLNASIRAVSFCISTEETRYYLNGACLSVVDGVLNITATDGHRLMREPIANAQFTPDLPARIIPSAVIKWVQTHIKSGVVEIVLAGYFAQFSAPDATIITKVIDGVFPSVEKVIPAGDGPHRLTPGDGFADAVKWLNKQGSDKTRAIKLTLNGAITANVRSMSVGDFEATLGGEYLGAGLSVGINGRYLSDALRAGGEPTLIFADEKEPVRIDYAGNPGRIGVLMPLRV